MEQTTVEFDWHLVRFYLALFYLNNDIVLLFVCNWLYLHEAYSPFTFEVRKRQWWSVCKLFFFLYRERNIIRWKREITREDKVKQNKKRKPPIQLHKTKHSNKKIEKETTTTSPKHSWKTPSAKHLHRKLEQNQHKSIIFLLQNFIRGT